MRQKRVMVWSIELPEESRTWNSYHAGTPAECEALERLLQQLAHYSGWTLREIYWEDVHEWDDATRLIADTRLADRIDRRTAT